MPKEKNALTAGSVSPFPHKEVDVKKQNSETTSSVYGDSFFQFLHAGASRSALYIVPKILEFTQPKSVVDVGCGTGDFLTVFHNLGTKEILGIDGKYALDSLVIPRENFIACDLSHPFTLDQTFDLAICLEVGEHLPPESASGFVASLTSLAPLILFSAAIPFQKGTKHVNEQWPEYWAALFQEQNFVAVDALRASIWHNREISYWYRQNMLFFCRKEILIDHEKLAYAYQTSHPDALSLVHPEMYMECNTKSQRAVRNMVDAFGHLKNLFV